MLFRDKSIKRIVYSEAIPMHHSVLRPDTTLKGVPPLYRQLSGFVDKCKFDFNHLRWPFRETEQHLEYSIIVMEKGELNPRYPFPILANHYPK